jgi:hypothetical protein
MLSGLVQNHEPVYVLWSYSETKETTLAFFVYSEGAFRYIGMPHPTSVEDYQESKGGEARTEPNPSPHYLTDDQSDMKPVLVDSTVVQRTVVLHLAIGTDGKVRDVSYVRGPEGYKDAAIKSVRKRKFEPPSFGPHGFHPNNLCVNEAAPVKLP